MTGKTVTGQTVAGQAALILGCEGEALSREEAAFFAATQPFGFILFARNVADADQLRALTSDLRAAVGRDAPILIDQEGGRVARLRPPLATDFLPPLDDVARLGAAAARGMHLRYQIIAAELARYGIDGNCVPALDIARPDTHPILRNRLLGMDADTVARLGRAVVDGTLAGGALPVIKHMPGHGRARVDSHLDLPRTEVEADALATDFAPFAALSDAPLGMTAHVVFAALDHRPATQSPVMVDLIRRRIGFDGLLMTDDISMQALSGDVATRGRRALEAGVDVVLHCNGDLAEMRALADTAGPLTGASARRAAAALAARPGAAPVDIAVLRAEFEGLGAAHPA